MKFKNLFVWGDPLEDKPGLKERFYHLITFYTGLLIFLVFEPINYFIEVPMLHHVVLSAFGLFSFSLFFLAIRKKRRYPLTFLITAMLCLDVIWFMNNGIQGSVNFFFLLFLAYGVVLLEKNRQLYILVPYSINFLSLLILASIFPHWIHVFTPENLFLDQLSGLFSASLGIFLLVGALMRNFDKDQMAEKRKTELLKEWSVKDPLTGIFNRRYTQQQLLQLKGKYMRYQRPFAGIIMDLDHFKMVNDTWGHPEGDRMLKQSVAVLQSCLRETDIIGRWGGEEFMILLPETDYKHLSTILEKIRKRISETVKKPDGTSLTASFGAGFFRHENTREFLEEVDQALYQAKESGRDQFIITNEPALSMDTV